MKTFIHLSEIQLYVNTPTTILLNDSILTGFDSYIEASKYCIKNNIQYKSIVNKLLNIKY